jgi:hypothetical protein
MDPPVNLEKSSFMEHLVLSPDGSMQPNESIIDESFVDKTGRLQNLEIETATVTVTTFDSHEPCNDENQQSSNRITYSHDGQLDESLIENMPDYSCASLNNQVEQDCPANNRKGTELTGTENVDLSGIMNPSESSKETGDVNLTTPGDLDNSNMDANQLDSPYKYRCVNNQDELGKSINHLVKDSQVMFNQMEYEYQVRKNFNYLIIKTKFEDIC